MPDTANAPVIDTHGINAGRPQRESAAAFNKVVVDSSQPVEVTLTLARYAAAASDPSLYFDGARMAAPLNSGVDASVCTRTDEELAAILKPV